MRSLACKLFFTTTLDRGLPLLSTVNLLLLLYRLLGDLGISLRLPLAFGDIVAEMAVLFFLGLGEMLGARDRLGGVVNCTLLCLLVRLLLDIFKLSTNMVASDAE